MKKMFFIFAMTIIAINANAQWFIAGSVGLNVTSTKETVPKPQWIGPMYSDIQSTSIGFSVSPKAGYYFSDRFAAGLSFSVGPNFRTYDYVLGDIPIDFKKQREWTVSWRVFPFVRYSVFTYKKFSIILEGRTGVGGAHYFSKIGEESKENNQNSIAIGVLNITPILGFKLTDKIQVEAGLHFLNLGYNIDFMKIRYLACIDGFGDIWKERKMTKHDLNIGFNSSSILVMTQLQFGIIYKF